MDRPIEVLLRTVQYNVCNLLHINVLVEKKTNFCIF